MTASELASFRALLQAQTAPPPRPDGGLFARMRARLTVVERGDAPPPTPLARATGPHPHLTLVEAGSEEDRAADPPPSTPPAFGRRDGGPPPPELPVASPRPVRPDLDAPVRLRAAAPPAELLSTPDELDDPRPEPSAPARIKAPAPGVIAGWSRARPATAQRRLLGRLEAVLLAEHEGLEARRAADAT